MKIMPSCGKSKIVHVLDRKGHDFRYAIDFSKAKREPNWEPIMPFEKSFENIIRHLLIDLRRKI